MAALLIGTLASAPAATASPGLKITSLTVSRFGYEDRAGFAHVFATYTCSEKIDDIEMGLEVHQQIHGLPFGANQYQDPPGGCGPTPRKVDLLVELFVPKPSYRCGPATADVWIFVRDDAGKLRRLGSDPKRHLAGAGALTARSASTPNVKALSA